MPHGVGACAGGAETRPTLPPARLPESCTPPGGPSLLPAKAVSLPTPHSPAQVSVRASAPESSRKRVRGAKIPSLASVETLSRRGSAGTLKPGTVATLIGCSRNPTPNGSEHWRRVISIREKGPDRLGEGEERRWGVAESPRLSLATPDTALGT